VFGTLENKKAKSIPKKTSDEEAQETHLENCTLAQLVHVSPEEQSAIDDLINVIAAEQRDPTKAELKLLRHKPAAVDIAMFGRMLAAEPSFNVEAAVQVAHAISVEPVIVEDDFFTAVDDLNSGEEDMGAGHVGETGFAAALFYLYVCIDRTELIENLQGDTALADKAIASLLRCAAQVSPTGKQNSFASRAHASYILAERGSEQPRTLSVAFLKAISREDDVLATAIQRLTEKRINFAKAYGESAQAPVVMNADSGDGSLDAIADYITG
jgi:CRISPR system Cascade subunit CasC